MPKDPKSEDPPMEDEELEDEEAGEGDTAAQLMRNPAVLAALQGRLDGLGSPSGYIEVRQALMGAGVGWGGLIGWGVMCDVECDGMDVTRCDADITNFIDPRGGSYDAHIAVFAVSGHNQNSVN